MSFPYGIFCHITLSEREKETKEEKVLYVLAAYNLVSGLSGYVKLEAFFGRPSCNVACQS